MHIPRLRLRSKNSATASATALACLLPFALSACSPKPQDAHPALWRIDDAQGHKGWLFGTIHSSEAPLKWRTTSVDDALRQSGVIMVEVANLANESEVGATFARLAQTEGQPPLSQRTTSKNRSALAKLMQKGGHKESDFSSIETWAAALILARAGTDNNHARNGVDRAVIAAAEKRPVIELEGAVHQLGLFDSLPEKEQRDLLDAVITEADVADGDLAKSWRTGDMVAIEKETRSGLLADPELREVLFTQRNRDWTKRIVHSVRKGQAPFIAVGTAHMVGPKGLAAMLNTEGLKVTRVQ